MVFFSINNKFNENFFVQNYSFFIYLNHWNEYNDSRLIEHQINRMKFSFVFDKTLRMRNVELTINIILESFSTKRNEEEILGNISLDKYSVQLENQIQQLRQSTILKWKSSTTIWRKIKDFISMINRFHQQILCLQ